MLRVDLAGINPKNSRMILEFQLSYRAGLLTTSDIHIISRGTEKDKRENEDYYSRLLKNRRRKKCCEKKENDFREEAGVFSLRAVSSQQTRKNESYCLKIERRRIKRKNFLCIMKIYSIDFITLL